MHNRMDLTFHLLETITNGFSEEQRVGRGGHGDVYRALYEGKEIAVKKLHPLQDLDDKEFDNEFRNLSKVQHQNIVRLVGYCYESRDTFVEHKGQLTRVKETLRALCFEYMQGGSLDKHIRDEESCGLDWPTCYKIIRGTCEGLNHLHNAQKKHIYHLDIKPGNILLDENRTPKIADLGLSRLLATTKTIMTDKIEGTLGYMPKEYIDNGYISKKFDVFSLGVLIIKIMAGNNSYFSCSEKRPEQFIEHVTGNWRPRLQGTPRYSSHEAQVKSCIEIALRCVEEDRHKRPTIKDIFDELDKLGPEPTAVSKAPIQQPPGMLKWDYQQVCKIPGITAPKGPGETRTKIMSTREFGDLTSVDVHPTKPWILTSHDDGYVSIWNYQTQERVMAVRVTKEAGVLYSLLYRNTTSSVYSAKFITRKWFVAGDGYGYIHVYSYFDSQKIKKFKAHPGSPVYSLAVHPTRPFLLSASQDGLIKLWEWGNGWVCGGTFAGHTSSVFQVTFNPKGTDTFASASASDVKVWTISYPTPRATLPGQYSVGYYFADSDPQYMIASSGSRKAYIWDSNQKRVHTLGEFANVVACHPKLPILVTGSIDGTVRLWNATNYRHEKMVRFMLGKVKDLRFINTKDFRRLVVGCRDGIAIMEINLPTLVDQQ